MIAIDRLQEQFDSSDKAHKGKIMSGSRERATKQYFKDTAARARRKQGKTRFDTHRRDEQPDAEDLRLEDIHFANFLGSKCEDGIPYNSTHIDEPVNLIECDLYLKPESSKNVPEEAAPQEEQDNTYNFGYGSWAPQISREPNTKWHMNWDYEPETQTLTGYSTYKRGRDEEGEAANSETSKRMRSDSYENTRMEEANFAAMVAYMRQQMELAQQMANEELYPCDCAHH